MKCIKLGLSFLFIAVAVLIMFAVFQNEAISLGSGSSMAIMLAVLFFLTGCCGVWYYRWTLRDDDYD